MSFSALQNHAQDVLESAEAAWQAAQLKDAPGAADAVARAERYLVKMRNDLEAIASKPDREGDVE